MFADYFGRKIFWKNHKFRWKILEFSKKRWVQTWVRTKNLMTTLRNPSLYIKIQNKRLYWEFSAVFEIFLFFLELKWYLSSFCKILEEKIFLDNIQLFSIICSRKSIFEVVKSYRKYLLSRIAAVWKTSFLEKKDSCIVWPVDLCSFFNLTITATLWSIN